MPKEIVETRNVFTDSEETVIGNCRDFTMNLPQGVLRCNPNQSMRLTLNTFSMKKNFYSVNKFNSVFYVVSTTTATGAIAFTAPVVIENGDYQSFNGDSYGLCAKIKSAIDASILSATGSPATATVLYNRLTKLMTISLDQKNYPNNTFYFVSFTVSNYNKGATGVVPTIIGDDDIYAFQDTHILLGGCKEVRNEVSSVQALTPLLNRTADTPGGTVSFVGYYNMNLSTESNLYLRTDLQSTSYQTAGFDTGDSLFPYIVSSAILAKIPIQPQQHAWYEEYNPEQNDITGVVNFEADTDVIRFKDNGNNIFSILMTSKGVSSMRLYITDSYGRPIPEISEQQLNCDAMPFTTSLRVDVFEEKEAG